MDMARIGLGRVVTAVVLATAALGGTASTAWSQQIMVFESVGGFRGARTASRVTSRSVAAYSRLLGLEETQVEIAQGLLEQYTANIEDASRERRNRLRALMEEFRETQDHTIMMERMPAISEDFAERSRAIEASFFSDLRLLLDDQQASKWERVQRLRRRETVLRQGSLSGETVDLIAIADSVGDGLDLGDEVRAALEQYELELDRALIAKAATLKKIRESSSGTFMGFDLSEMEEMSAKTREVGLRVRDLNRRHARLIESMLPEELAARFQDETRRRSFPRVYKESSVDRVLLAAESLDDLAPDQRQSLGEIHTSYTRDRAAADEKWVAAIRDQEEEGGTGWAVGQLMIRYSMGEDSDDPVSKARAARHKVDERYRDKVQAALTPDQRDQMPKPDDPQSGAGRRFQTESGMMIHLSPGGGG